MLQIITLGKTKGQEAYRKASGFVLDQSVLPKLFGPISERYSRRPGGYTRIHKFGNRFGDNAPAAILELVDNPRDIRLEVTARAVGWELLKHRLQTGDVSEILEKGVGGAHELIEKELALEPQEIGQLRPATRWNLQKVLKYRDPRFILAIGRRAQDHIVRPVGRFLWLYSCRSVESFAGETCDDEDSSG
jgi:large subunit ribosomal protein L17